MIIFTMIKKQLKEVQNGFSLFFCMFNMLGKLRETYLSILWIWKSLSNILILALSASNTCFSLDMLVPPSELVYTFKITFIICRTVLVLLGSDIYCLS